MRTPAERLANSPAHMNSRLGLLALIFTAALLPAYAQSPADTPPAPAMPGTDTPAPAALTPPPVDRAHEQLQQLDDWAAGRPRRNPTIVEAPKPAVPATAPSATTVLVAPVITTTGTPETTILVEPTAPALVPVAPVVNPAPTAPAVPAQVNVLPMAVAQAFDFADGTGKMLHVGADQYLRRDPLTRWLFVREGRRVLRYETSDDRAADGSVTCSELGLGVIFPPCESWRQQRSAAALAH